MNLRFIVMITGYVESASTACLIYQCGFFGNPGYDNYKDAITDLALDLYAKYYDDHMSAYERRYNRDVKECCRKTLIDNKEAKFCSACGSQIADKKFDAEAFMDYVRDLMNTTCDSYGDAEYAGGRNFTWWPYWIGDFIGAPKEDVIVMAENAEVTILAALIEAKPELKSEDDDYFVNETFWDDWEEFKNNKQPNYR